MSESLENKRLLSIDEAAEYFGCHSDTIRRFVDAGTIKSLRLGRVHRISRQHLDDLIESGAQLPVPPRVSKQDAAVLKAVDDYMEEAKG